MEPTSSTQLDTESYVTVCEESSSDEEKKTHSVGISLLGLPSDALFRVLGKCSFNELIALKQTCHTLNGFISGAVMSVGLMLESTKATILGLSYQIGSEGTYKPILGLISVEGKLDRIDEALELIDSFESIFYRYEGYFRLGMQLLAQGNYDDARLLANRIGEMDIPEGYQECVDNRLIVPRKVMVSGKDHLLKAIERAKREEANPSLVEFSPGNYTQERIELLQAQYNALKEVDQRLNEGGVEWAMSFAKSIENEETANQAFAKIIVRIFIKKGLKEAQQTFFHYEKDPKRQVDVLKIIAEELSSKGEYWAATLVLKARMEIQLEHGLLKSGNRSDNIRFDEAPRLFNLYERLVVHSRVGEAENPTRVEELEEIPERVVHAASLD